MKVKKVNFKNHTKFLSPAKYCLMLHDWGIMRFREIKHFSLWLQIKVRHQLWKNYSHPKLQLLTAADIVLYRHIILQFTGIKAAMHEMLIITSYHKKRENSLQKYLKQMLRATLDIGLCCPLECDKNKYASIFK